MTSLFPLLANQKLEFPSLMNGPCELRDTQGLSRQLDITDTSMSRQLHSFQKPRNTVARPPTLRNQSKYQSCS